MIPTARLTARRFSDVLIPLVDTASDALIRIQEPRRWRQTVDELTQLISDPEQWSLLSEPQREGAMKPLAVWLIGQRRWAWLQRFYVSEIEGGNRDAKTG